MIGFEPSFNLAGDCFQMWFSGAGANDKKIGKGRNPPEIQDHDLLRFLIRREVSASLG